MIFDLFDLFDHDLFLALFFFSERALRYRLYFAPHHSAVGVM